MNQSVRRLGNSLTFVNFTAFPGLINWQKRLWITLHDMRQTRDTCDVAFKKTSEFLEEDEKMFDARNYYVSGATFNYKYSHQLSVGISKMQGLTNSIRVSYDVLLEVAAITFVHNSSAPPKT
jgi:hypothetical protein